MPDLSFHRTLALGQRARARLLALVLAAAVIPSSAFSAVAWYPQKLYAGMNVVTISASSGLSRVQYRTRSGWADLRKGVALGNVRVASGPSLKDCPRKGRIYLYVPLVTERAVIDFRITECDGRTRTGRLTDDGTWNVDYVPMGIIRLGETDCARLRVTNENSNRIYGAREYTLDRVVSQSPLFRVVFTGRKPPVRILPGATYYYNVCVTGARLGRYRLPIHVYIRRDQPAGGFDSFIVADTVSVVVAEPARSAPPRAKRPPRPAVRTRPAPVRTDTVAPAVPRPPPIIRDSHVRPVPAVIVPEPVEQLRSAHEAIPLLAEPELIDPTTFRVMVMPTARSLDRGDFFIANYDVAGIIAGYGITDRLTVFGGGIYIPDAFGESIADATAGLRYEALRADHVRLAAGLQYNYSRSDSSTIHLLAPYAVISVGDDENRVNVAAGFTRRRHAPGSDPAFYRSAAFIAGGGDILVAPRWKIVGEFYSIAASDYQPIVLTARHFGVDWALDFGGALNLGIGGPKIAPLVAFVWVFR